ncbi:MAG TPA: four helix bundle protein [Saprospiraceae bacterium]|nr:four helix bundle protein [Saprospiraceae bacterium]
MARNDLEDRLIRFAVRAIKFADKLPKTAIGIRLKDQLIRASSSAPLNYGESQSAESRKDFIHKLKIVLKELRESNVALKMIEALELSKDKNEQQWLLNEVNELISIFVASVQTAEENDKIEKPKRR